MVAIVVTTEIRATLSAGGQERHVETTFAVSTVSHKVLCAALRAVEDAPSLQKLLSGAEIHLCHEDAVRAHVPPHRDPAVEARVERLRARLHDAQYSRMVRDVSRASGSNAEVESLRMAKFAPQFSLGLNVIVTMATCFVAGYFVMKNTSGSETIGLVGGVAGMIVAMGVEAVLLLTKMYTIDSAVSAESKKRERAAGRARRNE